MEDLLEGQGRLARNIRAVYGEAGAEWLDRLPALVAEISERWALTVAPAFPALSFNFVAPATRADGSAAVLKLGPPNPELDCEAAALQMHGGDGCVRLLDFDGEAGAMLIERIVPGEPLTTLGDDEAATTIAARLMRRLWKPLGEPHPFPPLERWTRSLREVRARHGGPGPFPEAMLARAESLLTDLLASAPTPVLLHGDLHHLNILSAEREPWLVIDPKGVAGDPGFDVGAWFYNPLPWLLEQRDARAITQRRLAQFADELEMDRERLRAWAFVTCMLSAAWTTEDAAGDASQAFACAALIEA